MSRAVTIELDKEDIHFSAAHFTIFSPTKRENLHGHDFFVGASATGPVDADGLCFDYNEVKSRLRALCAQLDETVLLPADSPHLTIHCDEKCIRVRFADEQLTFLRRDAKLLPVRNVTVEELGTWFLDALLADEGFRALPIDTLKVRVSSGPGQWARTTWYREAADRSASR